MATIINTKIGESKGRARVWVEGSKLSREGWDAGRNYTIHATGSEIRLAADEQGKYTVSRRSKNGNITPIIDLTCKAITEVFDGISKLRVLIKAGVIIISAHHQSERVKSRESRLMSRLQNGESLKVASLFHGGGVLDKAVHHGLESAGISSKIAVAVELESQYLDSSLTNNPELWDSSSIVIESPVQDVNLQQCNMEVDVLVAGIPCVGASKSGRSKLKLQFAESHDSAGALFFSFLQFAQVLNPALILVENVQEYANTSSMTVIRSVLGSLGYNLHETTLDGGRWVLERRKRLAVVAVSSGIDMSEFDIDSLTPSRLPEPNLGHILEAVPDDSDRYKPFDYLAAKEERDKAAGKGFARQLLTADSDGCGVIGKDYAKCRSTEPFIINPADSALSRLFTPVEHCRVKGIPAEVIQGLSDTVAHQILGQSVIYPAFKDLMQSVGQTLLTNTVNTAIAA